jgi:hypothetical protein
MERGKFSLNKTLDIYLFVRWLSPNRWRKKPYCLAFKELDGTLF